MLLQKDAFGRIIVGSKTELLRWQKQLPGVFCKKGVLKDFAKFTRKHLCWSFFWTKLQAEAFNCIKNRLHHRCFAANFVKFLKAPIHSKVWTATSGLINSCKISKWLLYTYYHIFCWMPKYSILCYLFSPVSPYAFDFKFYKQGYILIKSIVALSQLKLFYEC